MVIYKITNNINNKVYIGQTIRCLHERWQEHLCFTKKISKTNDYPLYRAMRKYGVENFMIKEVGGANSLSELNYQEWLLIHKSNTLWPNGYNLKEGGSNGRHSLSTKQKMSKNNAKNKQVINIDTGETYKSASECARKNSLNQSLLVNKLLGLKGNETPFRYVGMENVFKKPGKNKTKQVINLETGSIYESAAECARQHGFNRTTFRDMLVGKIHNNTPFRYIGMESVHKKFTKKAKRKVINLENGKIYESAAECARQHNFKRRYFAEKLEGRKINNTPFQYLDN
jgi:group I intron endonuclease